MPASTDSRRVSVSPPCLRVRLTQEARQERRMLGEVPRVRDDGVRQLAGHQVVPEGQPVDDLAVPHRRHLEVAMVGDERLAAGQPGQKGRQRSLNLRQVDAHHVVAANFTPRDGRKSGHHDALVEAEGHGRPHHPHAIHLLFVGQIVGVVRGQHRDGVAALGQGLRQSFHVDRQAAHVGAVIGQDKKNLHANNSGLAFTHSTRRAMPSRTLTCGAQPNSRRALLTSATNTG